jgi:hypothetical protein
MSSHGKLIYGVIKGKTVQLDDEPNLPDGQSVWVLLRPVREREGSRQRAGHGLIESFGAWTNDAEELDRLLETLRQARAVRV